MTFVDVFELKTNLKNCFKLNCSWYEDAVFFSMLTILSLLLLFVKFGFVLLILLLPYLLVVEKQVLIAKRNNKKLTWRDFVFSARRYGRFFCVFLTKILGHIFIFPALSLTFSNFILSDCKELDFKGVLILSNELARGKRFKIFMYGLTLFSMFLFSVMLAFLILQFVEIFCNVSTQFYAIVLIGASLSSLICLCIPMWRMYVEKLYLGQKTDTIRLN